MENKNNKTCYKGEFYSKTPNSEKKKKPKFLAQISKHPTNLDGVSDTFHLSRITFFKKKKLLISQNCPQ